MDWQNRWRECVLPALVVVLTSALCASPSFAQQQPAAVRSMPAATADTNVSGPDDLRGTTLFGEPAASRSNQLTDFRQEAFDTRAELSNDDPDQRARRDRDAFENPPAGHDPRYFQIEIEPLEDRRTRQFFEAEPFPHVGWRLGSFILFQEFEVAPAWDSNVFLGRNARGDWRADFSQKPGWSRTGPTMRLSCACSMTVHIIARLRKRMMPNKLMNCADASISRAAPTLKPAPPMKSARKAATQSIPLDHPARPVPTSSPIAQT